MADHDTPTVETRTPASADEAAAVGRPSSKAIGTRFGRYTIVKLIGRGGVGAVYEAEDTELGRRVALKLLRDDGAGDTEAIRREAQALAKLVHQNVVMVYDVGVSGGEVFLVMQLIEGVTIDQWLAKNRASTELVLAKFRQAGDGLVAAHTAGLVHCDFKPQNVLVDERGIVHVGDFGLARMMRFTSTPVAGPASGTTTTVAGTPAYMAPEQFEGRVTAASDQFSFCVALWECIAGERPFYESTSPVLDKSARGARRPLRRDVKMPRHVMRALERGMAANPADRFPTMEALLVALEPKRSRIKVAVIAGALGVIAGGAIAYFALRQPSRESSWDGADVAKTAALTSVGPMNCAYSPAFDRGGKRVVFDWTFNDTVDLYAVSIDGGKPVQLTEAATWEWRASPGRRAGEVLHLVQDLETQSSSMIAYLDLDTKRSTPVKYVLAVDAVQVGDTIYYSPDSQTGIRALEGKDDRSFLNPAAQDTYFQLAAAPTEDALVVTMSTANWGPTRPCIVDIRTAKSVCLKYNVLNRPAFSADSKALYIATHDGIVRHELATGAATTISKAYAEGGVAVSPDGSSLVYSTCKEHSSIVDLAPRQGMTTLDAREAAVAIAVSPRGHIAFARDDRGTKVIVLRTQDGTKTQLTDEQLGSVGSLAFDRHGKRLVFAASEPNAGLRILDVERPGEIYELTTDPRDKTPVFTESGLIAFSKADVNMNEQVYVIRDDGGPPRKISTGTRYVYGSRGNKLLVGSPEALYWLDPATGVEEPGPKLPVEADGRPTKHASLATSPTGSYIVMRAGVMNEEIWRARVDPPGPFELLHRFPAGINVAAPAITDDGHAIVPIGKYEGELFRIPARPGNKF